jgi:hypothetical protein
MRCKKPSGKWRWAPNKRHEHVAASRTLAAIGMKLSAAANFLSENPNCNCALPHKGVLKSGLYCFGWRTLSVSVEAIDRGWRISVPTPRSPSQNHLLAALAASERARLFPQLELVPMPLGKVLYESGSELDHVYFPTDCIVSLLYVMTDGSSAEIAVVGNEGLVGVALFMGGETTPSRAVVQSAGFAYRLEGTSMKQEFNRAGEMQHLLLRYTQALLTQMAQTAVCNRHHSVVSLAAAQS